MPNRPTARSLLYQYLHLAGILCEIYLYTENNIETNTKANNKIHGRIINYVGLTLTLFTHTAQGLTKDHEYK